MLTKGANCCDWRKGWSCDGRISHVWGEILKFWSRCSSIMLIQNWQFRFPHDWLLVVGLVVVVVLVLVVILLFQVVGVLAGLVVGILLLGFAIQFCRERGSASEKVKTGFCENNLQYFFNVMFHRIHRRWRRMWLKMWTEQKLLLCSWTSASRPQGKNPGLF